jgi:monomeric isocitrate dehydrogenase
VLSAAGGTLFEHDVEQGDVWRMCRVTDAAIRDWVGLAVTSRSRERRAGGVLARRATDPTTRN